MTFQKGQSGNPAGRPPGARHKATMLAEQLMDGEADAITRRAIELAKDGDSTAMRLCLDRLLPPRKQRTIAFDLPPLNTAGDAVSAMSAVAAAVAAGDLTPGEAADLMKVIECYARTLDLAAFEERLVKLEREVADDRARSQRDP